MAELPEALVAELIAFLNIVGGEVAHRPLNDPTARSPDAFEFAYGGWAMSLSSSLESPDDFVPLTEAQKFNLESRLKRSTGVEMSRDHWYPD